MPTTEIRLKQFLWFFHHIRLTDIALDHLQLSLGVKSEAKSLFDQLFPGLKWNENWTMTKRAKGTMIDIHWNSLEYGIPETET